MLAVGPGERFIVRGLEEQLARVVRNLIDNARSYSPAAEGVRLSLARQEEEIVLRVDDDGPGVQTGKEETIFERFYTDRPEAGGQDDWHSGLGLSISRDIVRLHGGSVGASNRRGADGSVLGARLELRLPAAEA